MLSLLLPSRCAACGSTGRSPCGSCAAALEVAPDLPTPDGLSWCAALVAYEGVGRELVAGLKLGNDRGALAPLAAAMAALVDPATVDVVTWAPTTSARRRGRGFDQARLLATAAARHLGLPARGLLRRRSGVVTGAGRRERAERVAFEAVAQRSARVVVVDDVRTTGATLSAAARALSAAGVLEVAGLTLAATPAPDAR